MEVGEHWAFRPKTTGQFHEVKIVAIGAKKPLKIRVQFVADEWEDERRWVSPARLEVQWNDVEEYRRADDAMVRLYAESQPSPVEAEAALQIFLAYDELWDGASFTRWSKGSLTTVTDVGSLSTTTGLSVEEILSDPVTVHQSTEVLLPWASTLKILTAMLHRDPSPMQKVLLENERQMQVESIIGTDIPEWVTGRAYHQSGEVLQKIFDEKFVPVHNQIREWLGDDALSQPSIADLQAELSRVGGIAQRAIQELKSLKSNRNADALLAELLDPYSAVREQTGYQTRTQRKAGEFWTPPYRWTLADDTSRGDDS